MHAWVADESWRVLDLPKEKTNPDPKALACYGLLRDDTDARRRRFVDGRQGCFANP